MPTLEPHEIPLRDSDSRCMFQPGPDKPFVVTPAAIEMYRDQIRRCLEELQGHAILSNGLDYLAVFEDERKPEPLCFIEGEDKITACSLLTIDAVRA